MCRSSARRPNNERAVVAAGNTSSRQPEPEGCALSENSREERKRRRWRRGCGGWRGIERKMVSSPNSQCASFYMAPLCA